MTSLRIDPTVTVYGLDYAQGNIDRAREGAERAGVADRCHFQRETVYDYDQQSLHREWHDWLFRNMPRCDGVMVGRFDGLFVGEFIEHVANYRDMID